MFLPVFLIIKSVDIILQIFYYKHVLEFHFIDSDSQSLSVLGRYPETEVVNHESLVLEVS